MEEQQQPNRKKETNNVLSAYSKYTTIAIQMVVIIVLTTLGGVRLDKWAGTEPILTVILSLLGVAAAIWLIIKEALRTK